MNWPVLFNGLKALSGLLTPVIAAIAAYIAYQQHLINRRQYRLALFERRLAVFNSTMKMIASVVQTARADLDQCFSFIKETRERDFLFGPEVGKFIDEVYSKAIELHAHLATFQPGGGAQLTEILNWFVGRHREAVKVFNRYMDFTKP